MKKLAVFQLMVITLSLFCLRGWAAIINVPVPYTTIQAGVDAAVAGDIILLAPATYFENVQVAKSVTIASQYILNNNPATIDQTIINGNSQGDVLTLSGSNVVVVGLTITGGQAGVRISNDCDNACSISHSKVTQNGDGVRLDDNSAGWQNVVQLSDCEVTNNAGYGIFLSGWSAHHFESVLISGNGNSGVACTHHASVVMLNVTSTYNTGVAGGGLFIQNDPGPPFQLENCLFWGNTPSQLYLESTYPLSPLSISIACSDVMGGEAGLDIPGLCNLQWDASNFDANPLYCDQQTGNYTLHDNSPCLPGNHPDQIACDLVGALGQGCGTIFVDCNGNSIQDVLDIANQTSADCNDNNIPDECDIALYGLQDCNGNDILDWCEIHSGALSDNNGNWIPDVCENLDHVFHVPVPYTTIQSAINAAADGDTVLVDEGIFYENIAFTDKNLIVASKALTTGDTSWVSRTVIDGGYAGAVATFTGSTQTSTLYGFTLRHGGNGVELWQWCSPRLLHLIIAENNGTAITSEGSGAIVDHTLISHNLAALSTVENSTIAITNSIICDNIFSGSLFNIAGISFPVFENVTISDNESVDGTVFWCGYPSVTTLNKVILRNSAQYEITIAMEEPSDVGITIACSNIRGGLAGINITSGDVAWGSGNFDLNPLFCDEANGNYSLHATSPCLPGNHPDNVDCGLIGAYGWGCGESMADCNNNGVADSLDIANGPSLNCNGNQEPDECETRSDFQYEVISMAGFGATAVHVVDMDGDGDLDALSCSYGDKEVRWHETVSGSPPTFVDHLIGTTETDPHDAQGADLDGDGDMDVAVADRSNGKLFWFECISPDTLFARHTVAVGLGEVFEVAAADFDGDGDVDLATGGSHLIWLENRMPADTTFALLQVDASSGFFGVWTGDLDGDHDQDLVAALRYGNAFRWYENTPAPGQRFERHDLPGDHTQAISGACGDLDGDGDLDILGQCLAGSERLFWFENPGGSSPVFTYNSIPSTLSNPVRLQAADLDGDGHLDIASAGNSNNSVLGYRNSGTVDPTFSEFVISGQTPAVYDVAVGDLDRDGDSDVLSASNGNSTVAWHRQMAHDCNGNLIPDDCDLANGSLLDCNLNGIPDYCEILTGLVPDVNHDGIPDGCLPPADHVFHVPDEYTTIQAAINAAADGDTVLVGPETYVENLSFTNRNILLASWALTTGDTSYVSQTIIYGNQDGGVVSFTGENQHSTMYGFTLTNGSAGIGINDFANPTLKHLKITNNVGAGIASWLGSGQLENVKISHNYGGAITAFRGLGFSISNVLITQNGGTTLHLTGPIGLSFMDVTIVDNDNMNGSAIVCAGSAGINLQNTIIRNNVLHEISLITDEGDNASVTISCCDVKGGQAGISNQGGVLTWGEGNFDLNPRFCDEFAESYALSSTSPCLPGNHPDQVDCGQIGAFGQGCDAPHVIRVPEDHLTIQAAIDAATDGNLVLVSRDTYVENLLINNKQVDVASMFIISGDSTDIYETIIDGDQTGSVLELRDYYSTITGFTIRNGNAPYGGGILIHDSDPILRNLRIVENTAGGGGGLCNISFGHATCQNVEISHNTAGAGSGILFFNHSAPHLTNVTMTGNIATTPGCGVIQSGGNEETTTVIENSIIWGNTPPEIHLSGVEGELRPSIRISCSDIEGGYGSVIVEGDFDVQWFPGNINNDPMFCDVANDDYHLQASSPCLPGNHPNSVDCGLIGAYDAGCGESTADCNHNGIADSLDIANHTSENCNGNQDPDECETRLAFVDGLISDAGDGSTAVNVLDMDGDGDLDALSCSVFDAGVHWHETVLGSPLTFEDHFIGITQEYPHDAQGADLDGDGDMDVIVADNYSHKLFWFECMTPDTVYTRREIASNLGAVWEVALADFDGDGDPDVATGSGSNLWWFENRWASQGTFQQRVVDTGSGFHGVWSGDLDGDHDQDLVAALRYSNAFRWYENTGDSTQCFLRHDLPGDHTYAISGACGDLNDDGDLDIVGQNLAGPNVLTWFENGGGVSPTFTERPIPTTLNNPCRVQVADLNGDGHQDIVSAANGLGAVMCLVNDGALSPAFADTLVSADAPGVYDVAVADLDRDGDFDVLSACNNNKVAWHQQTARDCNGNAIPDDCDLATGTLLDCNLNGIPDYCEILTGLVPDDNHDGVPDGCLPPADHVFHVPDEYTTIQAAINAAADGDTVLVDPAIYPEALDLSYRNIVVASRALTTGEDHYIAETILEGGVYFEGNTRAAQLHGFTIRNASQRLIACYGASPTLSHLILHQDSPTTGFYILGGSSPLVEDVVIWGLEGDVIVGSGPIAPVLINVDVVGNSGRVIAASEIDGATISLERVICTGNLQPSFMLGANEIEPHPSTLTIACSNIEGGPATVVMTTPGNTLNWDSLGNFDALPRFCNPDQGDFGLQPCSPCLPGNHPQGAACGLIGTFGAGCVNEMVDCNGNGQPDECDIAGGSSLDCQPNNIPDECDLASGASFDVNLNNTPDECEIINLDHPASYTTIAAALAAAHDGDRLQASPQRFKLEPQLDFGGKAIRLLVTGDAEQAAGGSLMLADGARFEADSIALAGQLRTGLGDEVDVVGDDLSLGAGGRLWGAAGSVLDFQLDRSLLCQGELRLDLMALMGVSDSLGLVGHSTLNEAGLVAEAMTNAGNLSLLGSQLLANRVHNQGNCQGWGDILADLDNSDSLLVQNGLVVTGDLANEGQILIQHGSLAVLGDVSGSGTIEGQMGTALTQTEPNVLAIGEGKLAQGHDVAVAPDPIHKDNMREDALKRRKQVFTARDRNSALPRLESYQQTRGAMSETERVEADGLVVLGSLAIGAAGALLMPQENAQLKVGGNLDLAIDDPARFDLSQATLQLAGTGDAPQLVELMSRDLGQDQPGAFPVGELLIGPTHTTVVFVDQHDNDGQGQGIPEGLYLTRLDVMEGCSLVTAGAQVYATEVVLNGQVDEPGNLHQLALEAPANLRLTLMTPTHYLLEWDAVEGADHYQVQAQRAVGPFELFGETATTEFLLSPPTTNPGNCWSFRVTALAGAVPPVVAAPPGRAPAGQSTGRDSR